MNTQLSSSSSALLLALVCSGVFTINTGAAHTSALGHVTMMSSSGEGLQSALGEDLETDDDQDPSGMFMEPAYFRVTQLSKEQQQNQKRSGRKKTKGRRRNKHITAVQSNQSQSTTVDPCLTSHLDFCIHGHCTYLQGLREPVCVCKRGYDGERCGIQLLGTSRDESDDERSHDALVIVAVVLSVISCLAILLMICVHYRTHHRFQAAFLSSTSEREKLEKKNIMV